MTPLAPLANAAKPPASGIHSKVPGAAAHDGGPRNGRRPTPFNELLDAFDADSQDKQSDETPQPSGGLLAAAVPPPGGPVPVPDPKNPLGGTDAGEQAGEGAAAIAVHPTEALAIDGANIEGKRNDVTSSCVQDLLAGAVLTSRLRAPYGGALESAARRFPPGDTASFAKAAEREADAAGNALAFEARLVRSFTPTKDTSTGPTRSSASLAPKAPSLAPAFKTPLVHPVRDGRPPVPPQEQGSAPKAFQSAVDSKSISEGQAENSPQPEIALPATGKTASSEREHSGTRRDEPRDPATHSTTERAEVPAEPSGQSEINDSQPPVLVSATAPRRPETPNPSVAETSPRPETYVRPAVLEMPVPPRAATPAHDIQLQVNRGDQRVDVRVIERAGEVHVAVRTQDTQLAGALRQDLPALSVRLDETGFRSSTWHPGAGLAEPLSRALETSPSGNSQQRQESSPHNGQQQDQPPPHRPKPPVEEGGSETQRKEFSWLFTQIS